MTSMTNPTPMTNNTPAINARQPKLLLVDDQPINLQTLYQTFSADHQLYMATNGEQSLNLAALHQPDLILLDLVMPEMDGYEVFRHLKENPATAHIPVIFITAHTGEASEVHGLDVGAVDFISKPINPQIVRARVKTHLTLQAQKLALQESEQHTQAILDNAIDGIITSNGQGVIESANRAVETIFGYTPAELLGQDIGLLIPEPYCSQYKAAFAGQVAVPSGDNSNKKEIEGRHKEGHVFPMEISMSNNLYHDRKMIVALMRDISERRRIEQMKTDFISTVSHELRTPLTSISGALGLVVGGAIGAVPPAVKSMIDMAHKNSLRLSHLINDLLDMEKMLAGKLNFEFKVQELMPLIDSAVESTRAYGERLKVDFCISQRAEGVRVNVDGDRLHQVLANFLSNAAKFSTSGEQVQITVNCDQASVRVAVIDHGAGVPEQFKSRIFQKFAQADSSNTRTKGGTGLGLAIAQEMILRMNGAIDFSSEEGKGSCFYFDLPMVADT
jgi:PAS domain S-box-containing protein